MAYKVLAKWILSIIVISGSLASQGQTISGKVIDKNNGQPISMAEVYLVDLKTGTTTDEFGEFTYNNYQHKAIHLQVSYIGYTTIDTIILSERTLPLLFYLEPGHYDLEEVIVSVPSGKLQRENVMRIEQKKLKELLLSAPTTLGEAISNIPGVNRYTTGSGISKPVIRGLSGNRIVSYDQGVRVENQQWGDEHGLGIGESGIESVEVIKGPASLLYGSDALGGVLYFVNDRYASQNTIQGYLQTTFHTGSMGSINNSGLKFHKGKLKFNVFGSYASHADYKVPKLGNVLNTRFDQSSIKSSIGYNTGNWISNLNYSYLNNHFGITEDATYIKETRRKVITPYQAIENHRLSSENTLFFGHNKLKFTLGYSDNYRKEFEDDADIHALGLKLYTYTYDIKWHSTTYWDKFDFVFGSQGMTQKNQNTGEEILIPDAKTRDIAAFGIANFIFENIHLQSGFRIDQRLIDTKYMESDERTFLPLKKSFNGFSYSAGAVLDLDKVKLRTNVSNGFRSPNTSELLSDGVHEGTIRYEKGNPNLKNEQATQIDLSFDYLTDHLEFGVSTFYNDIRDYVYLSPTGSLIDNHPVYEYQQSNASLYGGELSVHYHPHKLHWLHLETNVGNVTAQDNSGNPLPFIPQTKINSIVKAEFSMVGVLQLKSIHVQHIYKFKQDRTAVFETPTQAYNVFNIGLSMAIATKHQPIEINTGIKNLLNRSYIDHLSRFKPLNISNQGINIYCGLKVNLNKKLKE